MTHFDFTELAGADPIPWILGSDEPYAAWATLTARRDHRTISRITLLGDDTTAVEASGRYMKMPIGRIAESNSMSLPRVIQDKYSDNDRGAPMHTRILTALLALSLAFVPVACSSAVEPDEGTSGTPGEGPGMEIGLAPGLYDLEDGTAQAIGTLEWVDLEGGFWALTGGTAAEGDEGTTVAVIANGDELQDTLAPLEGRQVSIIGERFEGASIRMAGPEIVAETVEEMSDTPGAAE